MAEGPQLLPGFNHNVRHAGKLYHVQTEDSGTANPHVTTHLFLGGGVVATTRTSYADEVGLADLAPRVRKLMEAQHKEMLRRVVRGAFDEPSAEQQQPARDEAAAAVGPELPAPAVAVAPPAPEPAAPPPAPQPVNGAPAAAALPRAPAPPPPRPRVAPVDGWGPPVLSRASRAAPPAPSAPAPARADRRLDELILSYLAEDLGSKRER
jgi:hypothetical protein